MNGLRRFYIIFAAYLFNAALLVLFTVLIDLFSGSTVKVHWKEWMFISLIIVGTQVLFILPLVRPPKASLHGKSLILSTLIAAFVASLCTLAFIGFVYSLIVTMFFNFPRQDEIHTDIIWIFLACSWIVWSVLLVVFVNRGSRDGGFIVRLTGFLFAGSIIEFLLSIPLVIMVQRRSSCYCATGSFLSLIASFFASLWLFGPFIFILLFWRKRPWIKDHCVRCGYPRKIATGKVCSECGLIFK
ncbi:MAG: hypothetical protein QF718_07150 [Phycisphaerales bacterium]|jgi:hypothetical protein|nr:hypothetical protein [Phycisphaerales bacterium]